MLWQQRRWCTLLNLIDHIPAASHFGEALSEDEELARAWLARNEDTPAAGPRFSEWNPIVAELTALSDRIGELVAITISAHGGKRTHVTPRPRPKTAIDRVREEARRAKHDDLVRRLLPMHSNN